MSIEERIRIYKKKRRMYLLGLLIVTIVITAVTFYLISEPHFSGGFYIKYPALLIGGLFVLLFAASMGRTMLIIKNVNSIVQFYSETGNIDDALYILKQLIEQKGNWFDFNFLMGSYISLLSITVDANEITNVLGTYKKRLKSLNSNVVLNILKNLITYHEDNDRFFAFYELTINQKKRRVSKAVREQIDLQQKLLHIDYLMRSEQYEQALQELNDYGIKQEADKLVVYSRKATIYFLLNDQDNYRLYKEQAFQYSPTLIAYHNLKQLDETGEITYEPIDNEVYKGIAQKEAKRKPIIFVLLLVWFSFTLWSISNSYQKGLLGDTYTDFERLSKEYLDKDVVEIGTLFETDTVNVALFEAYDLVDDDDNSAERWTKNLRKVTIGVIYVNDDNEIYKYSFDEIDLSEKTEDIMLVSLDGYTIVINDSYEGSKINQVDYSGKSYPVKIFKATDGTTATGRYNYFEVGLVEGEVEDAVQLYFHHEE